MIKPSGAALVDAAVARRSPLEKSGDLSIVHIGHLFSAAIYRSALDYTLSSGRLSFLEVARDSSFCLNSMSRFFLRYHACHVERGH